MVKHIKLTPKLQVAINNSIIPPYSELKFREKDINNKKEYPDDLAKYIVKYPYFYSMTMNNGNSSSFKQKEVDNIKKDNIDDPKIKNIGVNNKELMNKLHD